VYADSELALRELRETANGLPADTRIFVGGMAAARLERSLGDSRIRVLADINGLRVALRELRVDRSAAAAE
jgi:hypothetical protein